MKKGEKKRQQKALARRTKRKLERAALRASAGSALLQARTYPIRGSWVQSGWRNEGIAEVVIARRQPNGRVLFGAFLVDLYCLGVKDYFTTSDVPYDQFMHDALPSLIHGGIPQQISADLAHEIVYGSIEYAARWGFEPHPDFEKAQYVLDSPDMHPRRGAVTFGKDGKPCYISGPYDDVDSIMEQLDRTAGPGNYHFMLGLNGSADDWLSSLDET